MYSFERTNHNVPLNFLFQNLYMLFLSARNVHHEYLFQKIEFFFIHQNNKTQHKMATLNISILHEFKYNKNFRSNSKQYIHI